MKRILFFIILIPLSVIAQRKTGSIKGRIITADGSPAYVTVELKKIKKITVTDKDGNFKLQNLAALNDTLLITSVESKTYSLPVTIQKEEAINLGEIRLAFNIGQLQDVEVKGRIARSYKSDYSFFGTKTQTALIEIPQSISSITKEMIQDKMEFTLKDAADQAAGVNQYSGYDEYAMRGFKAENARLINGLRGYNTSFISPMLVNVERIEVVKGPAAVLYGNCDPGGTINLVTKKPLTNKGGEINISGGRWEHFRVEGDVTGPLNKNKTLLYRFNAGYDNTRSFRNLFYAKSYQLAPSFSFIPNGRMEFNIDLSLSHINTIIDRGQPGFQNDRTLKSTPISLIASQPGDYLHETDLAANLLFSYKINKYISFNSGYLNYITDQNVAEHGVHSYITPDSVNLYFSSWDYHSLTHTFSEYFTLRFNTAKFNHQFLAGYDYISSSVKLNQQYFEQVDQFGTGNGIVGTFSLKNPKYVSRPTNKYQPSDYNSDSANVDGTVYHTHGIYIQEQISYKKWKLLIGLREAIYVAGGEQDSMNHAMENMMLPRIGLVFAIRPHVTFYATYNEGFDPFETSTSTQIFQAPFIPITSQLLEAGAKANLFNNKLSASVAMYQLTLHHVAVNANDISNPNLFIQQGEDRSKGVETEASGNITANLSIAVSYSYCVAKVIQSKIPSQVGTVVENAPKNTSNSWIKYTLSKGRLRGVGIAGGHSQVSARNTLDANLMLPGYIVLNASLRYERSHFKAAINFNNITNKTYWMGAYNNLNKWPGVPRNFMMTVGYKF